MGSRVFALVEFVSDGFRINELANLGSPRRACQKWALIRSRGSSDAEPSSGLIALVRSFVRSFVS